MMLLLCANSCPVVRTRLKHQPGVGEVKVQRVERPVGPASVAASARLCNAWRRASRLRAARLVGVGAGVAWQAVELQDAGKAAFWQVLSVAPDLAGGVWAPGKQQCGGTSNGTCTPQGSG